MLYLSSPSFVIRDKQRNLVCIIMYVSSYPCRNLIDVDGSPTTNYSHSSVDSSAAVGKPSASMSTPSSSSSSSSSSDQYRGLRVELPFDFLRVRNPIDSHSCYSNYLYYSSVSKPPGWVGSEQMIADEDLARMLQVI